MSEHSQNSELRTQNRAGYFGVEGIDDLLPSGISYDTQVMVQGDTGIGKSVLAAEFLYEGLLVGDRCIYVACDEPPQVMRGSMANLRLGTVAYEQTGQLVFIDAYTRSRSRERYSIPDPSNFDEFFLYQKRVIEEKEGAPIRLVVDSISTIFSTAGASDVLEFSGHRLRYLRSRQVLTLDVYVGGVMEDRAVAGLSHLYPMILRMQYVNVDGALQRYLQLGKLKSGQFTSTRYQFSIDAKTGIIVQRPR
ncbi:MAG: ATPase [Actinobacteria bacterium]|nr:ATPase [Actinomycetota bacterium]